MAIFGKKKKTSCCCSDMDVSKMGDGAEALTAAGIRILGPGCAKCQALEQSVSDALQDLDISEPIEHVTDMAQIAAYGVMSTPALVLDGRVVSYGKVLSAKEAKEIIRKARSS